jgi:hypothetical protein
MPLTFEALKSQRYRWCFGGIQILRMYWRSLIPGRRTADNNLTAGQRWGYLAGGIQWYGDLLGAVFYLFLLAGAVNLALGGGQLFRKLTGFLVGAVPVLVVLGLIRAVALLRRGTGATWSEALGSFFIWQATSLVVARASVQGLFAKKAAFLRTPKTFDETGVWQVIRANWAETGLALLGTGGIVVGLANITSLSGPLLAALLLAPTAGYAAAPYNSFAAQRAALPADLSRRRRTEFLRSPAVAGTAIAGGGVAVAVGAIAVVALLLTPDKTVVHAPSLVAPAHSSPHSGPPARHARTPSPSSTRTSAPSSSPSSRSSVPTPSSSVPSTSSTPTSSSAIPTPSSSPATSPVPSSSGSTTPSG